MYIPPNAWRECSFQSLLLVKHPAAAQAAGTAGPQASSEMSFSSMWHGGIHQESTPGDTEAYALTARLFSAGSDTYAEPTADSQGVNSLTGGVDQLYFDCFPVPSEPT